MSAMAEKGVFSSGQGLKGVVFDVFAGLVSNWKRSFDFRSVFVRPGERQGSNPERAHVLAVTVRRWFVESVESQVLLAC